jgi:hypothetical protein
MSRNRLTDELLSFSFVSYARSGRADRMHLSPAQIQQIARTVRRSPEVMVKMSGGAGSAKRVAAHIAYIGRGESRAENDMGDPLDGKDLRDALLQDWELDLDLAENRADYLGKPGPRAKRLTQNIVLSMPKGTPANDVLEASRAFAREEFGLKHRYALALHTDQPHPHVHLVVKMAGEQGQRLRIDRKKLKEWRLEFARQLRLRGVVANATDRSARGSAVEQRPAGLYRAIRAGKSHLQMNRAQAVARMLQEGQPITPEARARLVATRKAVIQGWLAIREQLVVQGQVPLAREIEPFLRAMPKVRTDQERIAEELLALHKQRAPAAQPPVSDMERTR